jgi:aldehyde:ferredoxin oxidoreductase
MTGYAGKIIHVNLTNGKIEIESPPEQFYRTYVGGSLMGTYYLLKEMPKGADPLGPDNVLTAFIGPATGAPVSGQSRICMNARSPMGGAVGDSQAGGFWPAELRRAGFDGLVLKGSSPKPVYIWVHDGAVELRSAEKIWGKETGETEDILQEELGDKKIEVLQIGPAGERGVLYAAVMNRATRANGRGGMGTVMGAKQLKAIVVRGTGKPEFADRDAIRALAKWGTENFENTSMARMREHGTAGGVDGQDASGGLPTRNWTSGTFEEHDAISGVTMTNTILKERDTCFACIVRCKRVVELTEGNYIVDPRYGGPEYETVGMLGSHCGVGDLAAVSKANELCNRYGIDTISCGGTIGWAMECFEHGIITEKDTGGLELRFGNAEAMVKVVELIGKSEGFGKVLAQGSVKAAKQYGKKAEDLLVAVKGVEYPAHMPQAKRGLALHYGVNPYGADHMSVEHDVAYATAEPGSYIPRLAEIGLVDPQPLRDLGLEKVRFALYTNYAYAVANTTAVCQFVYGPSWTPYSLSQLSDLVAACTGWSTSVYDLMKIGERTVNLQKAFNAREGIGADHDILPKKLTVPLKGGATDGEAVTLDSFEKAKAQYYALAGWDKKGTPTRGKLEELGVGWVADLLESGR